MGADFRYFLALMRATLKTTASMRAAYLIRAVFSIATHGAYLMIWFFLFRAVPSLGGWKLEHMLFAYGLSVAAWGLLSFFAYGLRTLPRQIDSGELDTLLIQPRSVLLGVMAGAAKTSGVGETVFGLVLMFWAAAKAGISFWIVGLVTLNAAVIFGAMVLGIASLGFWLRDFFDTAEMLYYTYNILASRPGPAFDGIIYVATLTVAPIAFMTHFPIEAIIDHKLSAALLSVCGTMVCIGVSYAIFRAGLNRYESGNRFGTRG